MSGTGCLDLIKSGLNCHSYKVQVCFGMSVLVITSWRIEAFSDCFASTKVIKRGEVIDTRVLGCTLEGTVDLIVPCLCGDGIAIGNRVSLA